VGSAFNQSRPNGWLAVIRRDRRWLKELLLREFFLKII
jgi:hypothetical protein